MVSLITRHDEINRPAALLDDDGSTHLADYSYLGAQGIIKTDYPEPDLRLDHTANGALDAFGRVIDHRWVDYGASADAVRIKHGYDEVGNRLWREDDVAANLSPAVHTDEYYTYDKVNRLLVAFRGDLNAAKTGLVADTGTYTQVTSLDKTGNWKQNYRDDDLATPGWDLSQTRTHNKANEITQLAGSAAHVAHDAAGNMTRVPTPGVWSDHFDLTFDGWNRLVAVDDGSEVVAEYEYDGRNFRITKTTEEEIRHYFYTQHWQCVEERATVDDSDVPAPEDLDADMQYVWGLRYVDDLILRDRDTSTPKNGTLDERLYAMQDANWNVVAVADSDGDVVERYLYSAYGDPVVLNADFSEDSDGTDHAWEFRFTGRRTDIETDLMYYRNRMYHPGLGRFVSRDPMCFAVIDNYLFVVANPLRYLDPDGLAPKCVAEVAGDTGGRLQQKEEGTIDSGGTGGDGNWKVWYTQYRIEGDMGYSKTGPSSISVYAWAKAKKQTTTRYRYLRPYREWVTRTIHGRKMHSKSSGGCSCRWDAAEERCRARGSATGESVDTDSWGFFSVLRLGAGSFVEIRPAPYDDSKREFKIGFLASYDSEIEWTGSLGGKVEGFSGSLNLKAERNSTRSVKNSTAIYVSCKCDDE